MRSVKTVALEAVVIGLMNSIIIFVLEKMNPKWKTWMLYFVSGALIHIIFEVLGGNEWWCLSTYHVNGK